MTTPLETVGPRAGSSPLTYTLTETGVVDLQSAFAHFDGAGAGGSFRPALTVRAQNGTILARVFPSETVAAGDSADVTFAPFLGKSGGYLTVQDEGVALTQRPILDFAGAGVVATDDAAGGRTLVTIPGGAGVIGPIDSTENVGDTWGVHSEGVAAAATDDFQRANENPLTQSGNWKTRSDLPFEIVSDLAVPVFTNGFAVYEGGGAFADGSSIAELGSSPTVVSAAFYATMRVQAAAESAALSGYAAMQVYNGLSHQVQIRKVAAGTETVLAFTDPWPLVGAPAIGDAIALYCNGTTLEAWSRLSGVWSLVVTTTDATYATGFAGMDTIKASVQAFYEVAGAVPASIASGPVTAGYVLKADGAGGSTWAADV